MPVYYFDLVSDDSVHTDIYYPFKDAPKIGAIIEHEGKHWRRMPTLPTTSSDSQSIDAFSQQAFTEKTGKMKGTWGAMEDFSKEMSEKRIQKLGYDPVLEKTEASREKLTGLKSFRKKKVEARESLAKKGIVLE
jgi:hypothetical protein